MCSSSLCDCQQSQFNLFQGPCGLCCASSDSVLLGLWKPEVVGVEEGNGKGGSVEAEGAAAYCCPLLEGQVWVINHTQK